MSHMLRNKQQRYLNRSKFLLTLYFKLIQRTLVLDFCLLLKLKLLEPCRTFDTHGLDNKCKLNW